MVNAGDFRAHIYRPLPELDRADAIVQRVTSALSLGLIRPGEQLPSEAELADMFGVAVSTLRDALSTLRELNVVATRRGRNGGTFVVGTPTFPTERMRRRITSLSVAEIRDLGDEHAVISSGTVRLAGDRADASDLAMLKDLAGALAEAETPGARARADSRFHIGLAAVAQSERLMAAELRIQAEVGGLLWAPLASEFDQKGAAEDHLSVVSALMSDDQATAQKIIHEHIRAGIYHLIDLNVTLTYAGQGEALR